jgi:hypothetical protein
MKRVSGFRKTASLSASLHRRLNAYALASSAAGVGILALTQVAEAKIVYTPAHVRIGPSDSYKLDLNHDGMVDYTIVNSTFRNSGTSFKRLVEKPAHGNAVEGFFSHAVWNRGFADALGFGSRISHGQTFYAGPALLAGVLFGPGGTTIPYGQWVNVSHLYLGLKFKIDGRTHYGWARLNVTVQKTSPVVSALLTGYAYETIPNKAIITGKTKGPESRDEEEAAVLTVPTPEGITLGTLAVGAPGLSIWRRKEAAGAAP